MINFVLTFHFTELGLIQWTMMYNTQILKQSTNNNFVECEIGNRYKKFNIDNSSHNMELLQDLKDMEYGFL